MLKRLPRLPERTMKIAGFTALFFVSVLITIAVLLAGARRQESAEPAAASGEEARRGSEPDAQIDQILKNFTAVGGDGAAAGSGKGPVGRFSEELALQDLLTADPTDPQIVEPYLFRPRLDRWSEEQVARFWIPLHEIALDIIREENDRNLKELFEEIP